MSNKETWMGRLIDEMNRDELAAALMAAGRLLRSATPASFARLNAEVRKTPTRTVVGRTFNWAFIPAGRLWSDEDRRAIQSSLDDFAARHGLQGAVVHLGPDRLDVEVPRPLEVEQVIALQEWLDAEGEMLDVSQVP